MNKLLAVFEKHLVPKMEKVNRYIWVSTLKDAIMQTLPMTLLGSIFCVLTVPADLLGWTWFSNFWTPWQWTMGLLAVFIAVLVPLNYLEKRKLRRQRVAGIMASVSCFIIIVNPSMVEEGALGLAQSLLGAGGMLAAILSGIYTSLVMERFGKFTFFKEDSAIPDFVRTWFDQMLPCGLCVLATWIIVDLCGISVFNILQTIFSPIGNILQTPYGMVLYCLLLCFNYSMGISNWVFNPIFNPLLTMAIVANVEMVREGTATVETLNLCTSPALYCAYIWLGGEGCTLALNLMSLRSKSNKIKSLSRASITPSIFNINEPIVFGMIAWNPYLMIPMWLCGIILPLVMFLFTKVIPFAPIPSIAVEFWCVPFPIVTWLTTYSWNAVILVIIIFIISWLIYYPFYKAYERQEVEKERIEMESSK